MSNRPAMTKSARPARGRNKLRTALRRCGAAALLVLLTGICVGAAGAAPRGGLVRIGMAAYLWGATSDMVTLRDALTQLGHRDNEDFAVGAVFGGGSEEKLAAILRGFAKGGADIIYVSGWKALQAARKIDTNTPIVFGTWYGPGGSGSLQSLAGAGGNVTGVVNTAAAAGPRALRMFRKLVPGLKRVLYPYDANGSLPSEQLHALRGTAARLGIELLPRPLRTQEEARRAILASPGEGIDGILPASNRLNIAGYVLEASARGRVAALFSRGWMAEYGGLASYGPSWEGLGRRAAELVDRLIKGARPREIPVQVNERMELVINLRSAKALGLEIAPEMLAQADRLVR
ncbi:MAG: ABC transporter substrate-binding protein [SAR324 cluster bacterium]|nr:ABC transporter substrate-binding protein [SAR324 cluster bacterium]